MSNLIRKGKRGEEEGGVLKAGLGLALKLDTYVADFESWRAIGKIRLLYNTLN